MDPYASGGRGGSYIGMAAVTDHKKRSSCGFWHCTFLNLPAPDIGTLRATWLRLEYVWDENTPSSKGPHNYVACNAAFPAFERVFP